MIIQKEINNNQDIYKLRKLCRDRYIDLDEELFYILSHYRDKIYKVILKINMHKKELIILVKDFIPKSEFLKIRELLDDFDVKIRRKTKIGKWQQKY